MRLYFEQLKNIKVKCLYYVFKSKEDAENKFVDPLYILADKSKAKQARENGYYVDVVTDREALTLYEDKMNESKKSTNEELGIDEKIAWLEQASSEELLKQYVSLMVTNHFGKNDEDIHLTRNEILKRMGN